MNYTNLYVRRTSRATAAAITIMLSMTASAQDSPRLRTPRRAVQGPIQSRFTPGAAANATAPGNFNAAQGPGPGPVGPGPGCNVFPASANIGTAVALSYFGPPPSSVNQSLVGPVQLLNTGDIDATAQATTLRSPSIWAI